MTRDGEVAYILDVEGGRVLRFPIEDFGGEIVDDAPPPPPQRQLRALPRQSPRQEYVQSEEVESKNVLLPPVPKNQRTKSIVPPHLVGIFKRPETPGADMETRNV